MVVRALLAGVLGAVGMLIFSVAGYAEEVSLVGLDHNKKEIPLHLQPDQNSQKIAFLKPDQMVVILLEEKEWNKVSELKKGQVGWVQKASLSEKTKITIDVVQQAEFQAVILKAHNGDSLRFYQRFSNPRTSDKNRIKELTQKFYQKRMDIEKHVAAAFRSMAESFKLFDHFSSNQETQDKIPATKSKADDRKSN